LCVQGWQPQAGRYDVIWIQWAIGHLTDEDFVKFFADCEKGLTPDGIVVRPTDPERPKSSGGQPHDDATAVNWAFRHHRCHPHTHRRFAKRHSRHHIIVPAGCAALNLRWNETRAPQVKRAVRVLKSSLTPHEEGEAAQVVKENNCSIGFLVDKDDSSVTRSDKYFRELFKRCNYELFLVEVCPLLIHSCCRHCLVGQASHCPPARRSAAVRPCAFCRSAATLAYLPLEH
jgi:hypothetical protein